MNRSDESGLSSAVADKLATLRQLVRALPSAVVAYSGGVDSAFMLAVARQELGERCLALTTSSHAVPARELAEARELATTLGAEHLVVDTDETDIAEYAANPTNRCYFCKDNLYTLCHAEAARRGIETILDGVNCDDLGDIRPGLDAAAEQQVRHLLVEAGMTKSDIRAASAALGLPTWSKPAQPCLASRFPYGTEITHARLERIEQAEEAVRSLGFREFRVRFASEGRARIEIAGAELDRARDDAMHARIVAEVRAAGFADAILDLRPFQSGRLNEETPAG